MMESRRALLTSIGATAFAVATPSLFARPQADSRGLYRDRQDRPGDSQARFSHAVADGVFGAFSAVMVNANDHARIQVAAHAWSVATGHFQETGLFRTGEQLLRDSDINAAIGAAANVPEEVIAAAAKHGVKLDAAALQARVTALTPDRVAEALAYLRTEGVSAVFGRVTEAFDDIAKRLRPRAPGERRVEAQAEGCKYLAMIEATLWILAGLYTLACFATAGVCVACCAAAAILGIAAGVLDLIGAYYC